MKRVSLSKLTVAALLGMGLALPVHAENKPTTTKAATTPAGKIAAGTATTPAGKTTTGKVTPPAGKTATGKATTPAGKTTAAATTKWTKEQITAIQTALAKHGEKVKTDGVMDTTTKTALQNFQTKNGLPKTGEPDTATLSKLGVKL